MAEVVEKGEYAEERGSGRIDKIWFVGLEIFENPANQLTVNQEPARGTHPLDITAPMSAQMHWDLEDRSGWPANLKLWQRPTPWINPTYNVGVMRYKGRIVHDFAGNPIQNFRIPLTISSMVEGLRIESWLRSDNRLSLGDIEARMWTKDGPQGRLPCFGKRLLSKRASLARVRAGLISWVAKRGRDAQTAYMDSLRTPANRAANQVRDEDLNAQQRAAYANMGLDESKRSSAPSRPVRIKKIKKAAARDGTAPASSSGAANPVAAASSEDSEDGAEAEADPETESDQEAQDQSQASERSWSSSIEDPLDSRNDFPTNLEEEAMLQRALEITTDEFVTLVGQDPAPTTRGDNYNSQWGTLQAQFRVLWAAADHPGHPVVEFGPPRLVARGRWTGGISRFEEAEEIEGEW